VVNFNYVRPSSPKLVLSRKVLLMAAACVSKFSFFEAFQPNSTLDHFITTDCLHMLHTLAKTEFPCLISDSPDATNSIRRSATTASGNVAKPMTSVFYDVIRLESIRGR